jgi:hypothetical protein
MFINGTPVWMQAFTLGLLFFGLTALQSLSMRKRRRVEGRSGSSSYSTYAPIKTFRWVSVMLPLAVACV